MPGCIAHTGVVAQLIREGRENADDTMLQRGSREGQRPYWTTTIDSGLDSPLGEPQMGNLGVSRDGQMHFWFSLFVEFIDKKKNQEKHHAHPLAILNLKYFNHLQSHA